MGASTADMIRFGLGTALPGTVIVGRDGRIAKVISGVVNQADLKKQIDSMLASAEQSSENERKKERAQIAKQSGVSSVPS
jgi:hypothetical protein